jgi:predicted nuclease with TOPRIM domain
LEQRLKELPAEPPSTTATSSNNANPVYIEVKAKIDATQREITRLRERQEQLRAKLADFESRVVQTNQVQRAYMDLTRDH